MYQPSASAFSPSVAEMLRTDYLSLNHPVFLSGLEVSEHVAVVQITER